MFLEDEVRAISTRKLPTQHKIEHLAPEPRLVHPGQYRQVSATDGVKLARPLSGVDQLHCFGRHAGV